MMLVAAIHAALADAEIDAHDGDPEVTPNGRYAAIYGETGLATPHRRNLVPHWLAETARIVVVARTQSGLRDLVKEIRSVLTGRILAPDFGPLLETGPSPQLAGGPQGDIRLSMTLTYSCTTPL